MRRKGERDKVRHERIVNESGLIGKTIIIEYECIHSKALLGRIAVRIVGVDYEVDWYPQFVLDRAIPMIERGEMILSRHLSAIVAADHYIACGRVFISVAQREFKDHLIPLSGPKWWSHLVHPVGDGPTWREEREGLLSRVRTSAQMHLT